MRVCLLASLLLMGGLELRSEEKKREPEAGISSIHPLAGRAGTTYKAVIRGRNLQGAHSLAITGEGITGRVLRVEAEAPEADAKNDGKVELAYVEISSEAGIRAGSRGLRLLTPNGVTNKISLRLSSEPVLSEADIGETVKVWPVTVTGRISKRGEEDSFWFNGAAGQTFTFEAKSGHASFDPSVSIFRPAPSWLDANRMEQVAHNDEALFFPGLSTDAHLVHTFQETGKYCVKVRSSSGQGSADAVYELRISEGASAMPQPHPKLKENGWEERQFTRDLSRLWQEHLALRGAQPKSENPVETYRAARVGSDEKPVVMRLPGIVEGRMAHAAEAHRIRIRVEKAENVAIEIQTPEATMPRFNPVILLFEPGGTEVATNVYTKRNNNGLYMMKMIQPKVTLALHAPGDYEMEIRDITTDRAGEDFHYRVLVRRQIPHVGKVEIAEGQMNLRPGATRELNITIEREEGFNGLVAFEVEGLPPGVTEMSAAPKLVEKPPLPNGGKLERYTPNIQNSALVFAAAADAVPSETASCVRIIARPVLNGTLGKPIVVKELPLMVLRGGTT